jgi:transposase-like protein
MNIVIEIDPFLKRLNEVRHLFDLIMLCRDITKASSLEIKRKILETKCELHTESILGQRWQREKPISGNKFICIKCGQEVGPEEIKRNGHYHKGLNFDEGYAKLRVPQLVHKKRECLGVIQVNWPFLEKRKRFWFDVIFNIVGYYFEGIGLRGIRRVIEVRQGTSLGIMSIWRMIQRAGETLRRCCPTPTAKGVIAIGLDEVFMRLRIFRGKGKRVLKKTLYGLMIKALGAGMPLLSFGISTRRDESRWQEEVDDLEARGTNHDNGLELAISDGSAAIANAVKTGLPWVLFQECCFHIQKDLLKLLREKYGRRSKRVRRICKKVKAVFRAETLKAAEAKLEKLSSISQFAYDYLKSKKEHMFTYLVQKKMAREQKKEALVCNTNNGMERENRELKKRLKIMVSFKSVYGAENFAAIMLRREFYRIQGRSWLENLFSEISINPRPIEKSPPAKERAPCLSGAEANRMVGRPTRTSKQINHELPIIKTSNNFALERLRPLIDGHSILEN